MSVTNVDTNDWPSHEKEKKTYNRHESRKIQIDEDEGTFCPSCERFLSWSYLSKNDHCYHCKEKIEV